MLLRASARAVMDAGEGRLRNQLARPHVPFVPEPTRTEISDRPSAVVAAPPGAAPASGGDLEFFNGFGGFAADGREYIVRDRAIDAAGPVDQRRRARDVRVCLHRVRRRATRGRATATTTA